MTRWQQFIIRNFEATVLLVATGSVIAGCDYNGGGSAGSAQKPAEFVAPGPSRTDEVRVGSVIGSEGSWSSHVEWYVSTNVLARQPRWDGLSTEAPLSVAKACALAQPHVRELVPALESWAVESVYLRNLYRGGGKERMYSYPDVWCYQITFMPRDPEVRARVERQATGYAMTQIVLLDGTVVPLTVVRKE